MIYADYAATTPVDKRVLESMMPYLTDVFYNASSTHAAGMEAQRAVMQARMTVAKHIGAKMSEVVFTSGATEAIALGVIGFFRKHATAQRRTFVTCSTEHMAMIDVAKELQRLDFAVRFLPVNEHGRIPYEAAEQMMDSSVLLVSVMAVNNETGVVQDLQALSKLAHEHGACFMTDATQAYGKMHLNVDELGIDLMSFSAHKIYGPKGAGALYHRMHGRTCEVYPLQFGGGQEGGIRSGTLNVPGIVGLSAAGTLAYDLLEEESQRIRSLRERFENAVTELGAIVNGAGAKRSYNISNVTFPGVPAHLLQLRMDKVACSQGSACSSAKSTPSHVLTAMGRTPEQTECSLRFSFGRYNTDSEVSELIDIVRDALRSVRSEIPHSLTT